MHSSETRYRQPSNSRSYSIAAVCLSIAVRHLLEEGFEILFCPPYSVRFFPCHVRAWGLPRPCKTPPAFLTTRLQELVGNRLITSTSSYLNRHERYGTSGAGTNGANVAPAAVHQRETRVYGGRRARSHVQLHRDDTCGALRGVHFCLFHCR